MKIINENNFFEITIEKLGTYFDLLPISISISSVEDGKFIYINKSLEKLFCVKRKNILNKKFTELDVLTKNDRDEISKKIGTKGTISNINIELSTLNKPNKNILISIRRIVINENNCFITTATDITEKIKINKKIEVLNKEIATQEFEKQNLTKSLYIANIELSFQKSIAQKHLYTRSLIEASLDPLFTISPEGKITDTNEATVRATGFTKKQLIDSNFKDYFTNPERAKQGYKRVFSKGIIVNFPLTINNLKSTEILFNGSLYKSEDKKIIGAVVVGRDVTEQKRLERELIEAKINAELDRNMAEKAKNNAIEAAKSKQQFLSNMSHEIRTPMSAIIGFTKVVLKTQLTAKQREYLTAIKMSGDSLIVLINDILDLAKVDSGKITFEKTPFKLSVSIASTLHLFETKIQEKNIELLINYDKNIPLIILGDPIRLNQIILNLVSNAVKFTNKGSIIVAIKLINENKKNIKVKFSIADTGIGINPTKISTIFDNFQQATSDTSRLFGGTGLGLAIVKQLIEAQKGKIEVFSEENKGTTFSFFLNFEKTTINEIQEAEILEFDSSKKNTSVLVVEDIELNQLLMKTLLDEFGFECEITSNGKLAIEKLKIKTYDIILMDLQMPEMNGFEATEYIRKEMKLNIPIIALTADVTTVDVEKCKTVGMNDYIAKPVDERLLYTKLIAFSKKPIPILETIKTENSLNKTVKYIDLDYLKKLTKSDPKLILQMINAYLNQTPTLISTIRKSLKDNDWKMIHAAVHKMIPSFSIIGLSPNVLDIAKKIQEYEFSLESSEEINNLITELEKICLGSCEELQIELDNLNV